jgi:hypothetical protein
MAFIQLGGNGGVALGAGRLNFTNDWQDVSSEPSCRVLDHDIAQDPGFPNLRIIAAANGAARASSICCPRVG